MCSAADERIRDSDALKGPGGGEWSWEWYFLGFERYLR